MLVPGAETRPKRSSEGFDLGVLFGVFKGCPISQWLGSCPKPMADLRGARVLLSGETRWEQASLGFFGCCIFSLMLEQNLPWVSVMLEEISANPKTL